MRDSDNQPIDKDGLEKLFSRITLPADVIRKKEAMKEEVRRNIHLKIARQQRVARIRRISLGVISSAACILLFILLNRIYDDQNQLNEKERLISILNTSVPPMSGEIYIVTETMQEVIQQEDTLIHTHTGQIRAVQQGKQILKDDPSEFITLIVPKGKRTTVVLSDGTTAWINSGTRLVYPKTFNGKYRDISVDGEIFLDVAKDTQHPFRVFSKTFEVEVLGTQFNFNSYEEENAHVVLVEGEVRVISGAGCSMLQPNEGFFLQNGEILKKKVDTELFVSWKDGKMKFKDELLRDIVNRLANYYGVEIELNELSHTIRMTGSLNLRESIYEILETFVESMSMEMIIKDNVIYMK